MENLMDKCCNRCIHEKGNPCEKFILCRTRGPLCHEDEDCRRERARLIGNAQSGEGKGIQIIVGMGTCGIAAGARDVTDAIIDELQKRGVEASISHTGCIGMCEQEVVVDIVMPGQDRISYGKVTPDMVAKIINQHVVNDQIVNHWAIGKLERK